MSLYDYSLEDTHSLRSFSDNDLRFEFHVPLNDDIMDDSFALRPRARTVLVMRLLQEIRLSISSFRPSESLAVLASQSYHSRLSLADRMLDSPYKGDSQIM